MGYRKTSNFFHLQVINSTSGYKERSRIKCRCMGNWMHLWASLQGTHPQWEGGTGGQGIHTEEASPQTIQPTWTDQRIKTDAVIHSLPTNYRINLNCRSTSEWDKRHQEPFHALPPPPSCPPSNQAYPAKNKNHPETKEFIQAFSKTIIIYRFLNSNRSANAIQVWSWEKLP